MPNPNFPHNRPVGGKTPPPVPNPVRAMLSAHRVPLSFLAAHLGVGRDWLARQRDDKAPISRKLALAIEALDYRWQRFGHGYVHPNKLHPTRRKKL